MTALNQVYKCFLCGNVVEVLGAGAGTLTCCEKAMMHLAENTQEAATEKHIPVVAQTEEGIAVVVGEVEHPMEEDHFIEWIEVITADEVLRKDLIPGEAPKASFVIDLEKVISVRAYCNLHGLWKSDM